MLISKDIFNLLKDNGINCFCGVPDSLLKDFCAYITDHTTQREHTITANEGNAIALAAGHYLATGHPALVYMQNSGLGNCINPLLSLTDNEVYNIPLLMFIGWRGEPNTKDEPQHIKQGKVTDKLLEVMGIKFSILPEQPEIAQKALQEAFAYIKQTDRPYAFLIKKGTFEKYTLINRTPNLYSLTREQVIETIIKRLHLSDVIVSTTGHISREVYDTRERLHQSHKQDFLTVGSMGHSSSIALGIALEKPSRTVYCFDGDGALLMHMGALCVNTSKKLSNLKHIVFNNQAHDSVGSQPTVASGINLTEIAKNAGYEKVYSVDSKDDLEHVLSTFIKEQCTSMLEIKIKCGARADLGRPKEKPWENKKIFMENLNQIDFCYRGAVENLSSILNNESVHRALVFTGKKSFLKIKSIIDKELKDVVAVYYNNFSTNPKKEELDIAIHKLGSKYDIIIAVGGGSIMDFAKAYRYYTGMTTKLIAIPTTFGTGAEATQFAVIYQNGVKMSLDDKSILPEYAIVDSQFATTTLPYLKACTAMDAFCQAIESYWAVNATKDSRELAKQAIMICKEVIVKYVNTDDLDAAKSMAFASHIAGKAINISRTTAAHALSYKITSDYAIPHGHAVALSIARLFEYNLKNGKYKELEDILTDDPVTYFDDLFNKIGLNYHCKEIGISDIESIVENVNLERLSNNPCKLEKDDLIKLFW